MRCKMFITALLTLAFGVVSQPAMAQTAAPAIPIKYGDTLKGTISDKTPLPSYSFQGKAGEDVVITIDETADTGGSSYNTHLITPGKSGDPANIGSPEVVQLPMSGQYTIGFDNVSGSGKFSISLAIVEPLTIGSPVQTSVSEDSNFVVTPALYILPAKKALQFQVSYGVVTLKDKPAPQGNSITPRIKIESLSSFYSTFSIDVAELNGTFTNLSFAIPANDQPELLKIDASGFSSSGLPYALLKMPVTITATVAK